MSDLADARLAAQRALSRALASARDVRAATPAILAAISKPLGCVVSEMWVVDDARDVLRAVGAWTGGERYAGFIERGAAVEFVPGRGLPGLAWERAAPQWMTDVATDDVFERKLPAGAYGVHAAVAFPILFGGEVTGAVQFFFPAVREPDAAMMESFADIGEQLGLFLERARVDEVSLRQAAEILELSAPLLLVAPRTLLLPVIGSFDARRAVHVTERLLARVSETGARHVVLDLTGAGAVDTFMAQRMLDAITAVKLLGSQPILTGLPPSAARTLVMLGVSLGDVKAFASLADGLAFVRGEAPAPRAS